MTCIREKLNSQSKFHNSIAVEGGGHLAAGRGVDVCSGKSENGMIEQVEEFRPELHSRRFRNRKLLHCREIELIQIVAPKMLRPEFPYV